MEPEYQGAVIATCKAIWLTRLLKHLHMEVSDPTTIYSDNLNNIHALTKHIEVHYHFIRERVLSSEVELV